jgi:hypothetical protein
MAAYGGFFIPKSYGTLDPDDRRPEAALYLLVFYLCLHRRHWSTPQQRGKPAAHPEPPEPMSHFLDRLNYFSQPREVLRRRPRRSHREDRTWEDAYRNRWRQDKIVRSTTA